MPKKRNQTSFEKGHKRSAESIEKQRRTMKAKGLEPPRPEWTPERIARREATRKERYPPRGWRLQNCGGYIYRQLMTIEGYRYEHRLVMEDHIGRELSRSEHVHHKDHDTLNNDIENLELMTASEHTIKHHKGKPSPRRGIRLLGEKWARGHDQCVRCGKVSSPHACKGLCRACYAADWRSKR